MKINNSSVSLIAWLTGIITLLLATLLSISGTLTPLNKLLTSWTAALGEQNTPLPSWLEILFTTFAAFLPPFMILYTPGLGRRIILWLTTLLITAAWLPIIALAGLISPIAAPLIACLLSGLAAILYSMNRQLPIDSPLTTPSPSHKKA